MLGLLPVACTGILRQLSIIPEMKTFFFVGRNPENDCGMSWKIWKIRRVGRTVETFWGAGTKEKHRLVPVGKLQSRRWSFRSETKAIACYQERISEKLRKGYEPSTRSMPRR